MGAQWHGWIMVLDGERRRAELEAMGVELGEWDPALQIYNRCLLSDQAFARLLKRRGRYLWKLSRIRKSSK